MVEVKIHKISSEITADIEVYDETTDRWSIDSELDFSDYLIERDIVIDESVELASAFELNAGGVSLKFLYDPTLWAYIYDSDYIKKESLGYVMEINLDGTTIFWGAVEKDSIVWDKINSYIEISASNMFKFLIDSISHKIVKHFGNAYNNIREYLYEYFEGDLMDDVSVEVGDTPTDLDVSFIPTLSTQGMKIGDLVEDMQRQYGAFLYMSADKILHFTNRGYKSDSTTAIDSLIVEESYELTNEQKEYDSVVCNIISEFWASFGGIPTDLPVYEWVLIHEVDGEQELVPLYNDIANVPEKYRYLDMRQKLLYNETSESFEHGTVWKLYGEEQEVFEYNFTYLDTWSLYENVTHVTEIVSCVCLGNSFSIFDSISIGAVEYQLFSVNKNYTKGKSELLLKRLL